MTQDRLNAAKIFSLRKFVVLAAVVAVAAPVHAAPKRPQVVPENLLGVWATEPKTCAEHYAEGLLKVEGNIMQFHASLYDIRRVDRVPGGALKLSGMRSNEGDDERPVRDFVKLKFLSPDRFELIDHPEGQFYERCKKPGS